MGCEWKSGDGKYCKFCCAYEYGRIEELEAYVGEKCNDNFSTCPIAYAFCPTEEWEEPNAEKGSGDEQKKNDDLYPSCRGWSDTSEFNGDDEDIENLSCRGSKHTSTRPFYIKNSFSDFFVGFTGSGFLIGFIKAMGLLALLVISIAGAMHFVDQLALPDNLFSSFLECAVIAGIPTLFVIAFVFYKWRALSVPIIYSVIGLLILLSGANSSLTSIAKVIGAIGSVIVIIAGAAPGLTTLILVKLFGDNLHFQGAYLIVVSIAAIVSALAFGVLYCRLISKHSK